MHLHENKSHLTDVVSRQLIEQFKVIMTGEKHVITSGTFKDKKSTLQMNTRQQDMTKSVSSCDMQRTRHYLVGLAM